MSFCALVTSSHFCQTLMKALAVLAKLSYTERLKLSSSFGGSECFAMFPSYPMVNNIFFLFSSPSSCTPSQGLGNHALYEPTLPRSPVWHGCPYQAHKTSDDIGLEVIKTTTPPTKIRWRFLRGRCFATLQIWQTHW